MVPLVLTISMVQVVTPVSALLATWDPAANLKLMSVAQARARMGDPAP